MKLFFGAVVAVSVAITSTILIAENMMVGEDKSSVTRALRKAMFAGGCFWCMEGPFEKLDGVVSVTSGYAGGSSKNPTYDNYITEQKDFGFLMMRTEVRRKNSLRNGEIVEKDNFRIEATQQYSWRGITGYIAKILSLNVATHL